MANHYREVFRSIEKKLQPMPCIVSTTRARSRNMFRISHQEMAFASETRVMDVSVPPALQAQ